MSSVIDAPMSVNIPTLDDLEKFASRQRLAVAATTPRWQRSSGELSTEIISPAA
jgi:hypothetical protein